MHMHGIPHALGQREVGALCVERLAVFVPSLPYPLLYTVYQCDGCLSYLGRGAGAHGWVVGFCQPSVRSPSWSWLPIVVAPGCLGHPTSTVSDRATKLFIIEKTNLWCSLFSKIIVSLICWKIKIHYLPAQFPNNKTVQAQNQAIIG